VVDIRNYMIYLAGGMGDLSFEEQNQWRQRVKCYFEEWAKSSLYDVHVTNPVDYYNFETIRHETEREVMEFDLHKVRNSDLIIANFNDPKSLGTMAELAIAYDHRIPIVGLNENKFELHAWQTEFCNRIFDTMEEIYEYVAEFYLN
jgi:nucleoside 2-deoxyribosyltransferase